MIIDGYIYIKYAYQRFAIKILGKIKFIYD